MQSRQTVGKQEAFYMNNILLGKTLKAMYKLSGKTLGELADASELSPDTVNNLFYARIQKPGFAGVCALTRAAGFTVSELTDYMQHAADLPSGSDITDDFTQYIFSMQESKESTENKLNPVAAAAHADAAVTPDTLPSGHNAICDALIDALNKSHSKQLDLLHEEYAAEHEHEMNALKAARRTACILAAILALETTASLLILALLL